MKESLKKDFWEIGDDYIQEVKKREEQMYVGFVLLYGFDLIELTAHK